MEEKKTSQPSLNQYIEKSIKRNWEQMALSDLGGINHR